jgi:DNA invertase Pin-like site-specific DNA recombinase
MKKAIIYTRGADREEQKKHCEEYARKRGYYVVASDMDWEDIEKTVIIGDVDAVIVVDLARITRKYAEYVSTKNIFKVFGVRLVIAPNFKGGKVR